MHLLARLFLSCLLTCNSSSCKLQPCTGKTFNSVPPLVSACCFSSFMDLFQEFVGHLQVYLSLSLNWHPRHLLSVFPTYIMPGSLCSWHYSDRIKFAFFFFFGLFVCLFVCLLIINFPKDFSFTSSLFIFNTWITIFTCVQYVSLCMTADVVYFTLLIVNYIMRLIQKVSTVSL